MKNESWDFNCFKENFRKMTSLDLDSYKQRQMERRIRQMMNREGCGGFYQFYKYMESNEEALNKFLTYLTINTSGFFRDGNVYAYLKSTVLPLLLKKYGYLFIWSAGCSTGEEPYTLAIILEELNALNRARLIASDFDRRALEHAGKGVFNFKQVEKVPAGMEERCFFQEGEYYCIKDRYKKAVTFKHQNLLEPLNGFRQMHLILCRNVFIYFKTEVQEEMIGRFVHLLPEGGYLVIGCSEHISESRRFGLERLYSSVYCKVKK